MPVTCIVIGCGSRTNRDKVGMYSVPTVTNHRLLESKNDLSRKRRALWLAAIKRDDLTDSKLKNQRVCSRHFLNGKPAALEDQTNPDWVPSQNMGHTSQMIERSYGEIMRHRRGKQKLNRADSCIATKKFRPRRRFGERPLNNQLLRIHLLREDLNLKKQKVVSFVSQKSKEDKASDKSASSVLKDSVETKTFEKVAVNSSTIIIKPIEKTTKVQSKKPFRITLTPRKKETMNGTTHYQEPTKFIKSYYIKFPIPTKHSDGKLQFKFTQLVNDVKTMQLPTTNWKIKVIIKSQKISAVVFTNKAEIERSVTFTADKDTYDIIFDNRPALLLGSPGKVESAKEIEVLLQVLDQLHKDSMMIMYK